MAYLLACLLTYLLAYLLTEVTQEMAPVPSKEGVQNDDVNRKCVAVHWHRHGLRLHDNPALLAALEGADTLYPIFIFDGDVAGK